MDPVYTRRNVVPRYLGYIRNVQDSIVTVMTVQFCIIGGSGHRDWMDLFSLKRGSLQ